VSLLLIQKELRAWAWEGQPVTTITMVRIKNATLPHAKTKHFTK
jgi:hypothetical protein